MLDTLLTEERILIDSATDWKDAIRKASAPLVADGSVEERYVDQILENVAKPGGTYMDLGFGFTLAHARPEAGVVRTAVAVMVLPEPVLLNDDAAHPVDVVLVLAAEDASQHQSTMKQLARLLTDTQRRDALKASRTAREVTGVVTG